MAIGRKARIRDALGDASDRLLTMLHEELSEAAGGLDELMREIDIEIVDRASTHVDDVQLELITRPVRMPNLAVWG